MYFLYTFLSIIAPMLMNIALNFFEVCDSRDNTFLLLPKMHWNDPYVFGEKVHVLLHNLIIHPEDNITDN